MFLLFCSFKGVCFVTLEYSVSINGIFSKNYINYPTLVRPNETYIGMESIFFLKALSIGIQFPCQIIFSFLLYREFLMP